jgi:hypothetical protein
MMVITFYQGFLQGVSRRLPKLSTISSKNSSKPETKNPSNASSLLGFETSQLPDAEMETVNT